MSTIYQAVAGRLAAGGPFALATIIETGGSAPQVPGASALFSELGLILGTVGGGPLEAEAGRRSREALASGRSALFRFDLRGSILEDEAPVCGGEAVVLIDASPGSHLDVFLGLREALRARRSGVLVTGVRLDASADPVVRRRWEEASAAAPALPEGGLPVLRPAADDPSGAGFDFLEPLAPLPRLLIVGAGHVGRAVSRLAVPLGFEVSVIDDRPEFASPERFPEADRLIVDDPGRALAEFPVSRDTYIVIVTRGHKDDAAALRACIKSPAAYVGMIGSRSKVGIVRGHFLAEGWASEAEFDRVRTPIGLPIGSKTVEEIAVSIAAELVQVRSRAGAAARPDER